LNLLNEDLATRVVLGLGNMPTEEESIAAAIAVSMVSASNKEQEDEAEARARAGLNAKGYTVGQDDPKKDYDGECLLRAVSPEGAGQETLDVLRVGAVKAHQETRIADLEKAKLERLCSGEDPSVVDTWHGVQTEKLNKYVEAMVKPCRCGGKYTFDAPPRCPECRSIHLEETGEEPSIYYD
jgi:hypothetical protein